MVSLIITAHNYAQYVERAIRSALDQSLGQSEYEILVINDASTDHTQEVLENYKEEIRVFNLEQNLGLSGARNFGIQKAKGQFIIFLDADDYIHRDLLKVQKLFLEENTKLDAVSTDYYLVNEPIPVLLIKTSKDLLDLANSLKASVTESSLPISHLM